MARHRPPRERNDVIDHSTDPEAAIQDLWSFA